MAKSEEGPRRPDFNETQTAQVLIDPVCGMEVNPRKGYSATHDNKEYRFCSLSCLDKFKASPEAFVKR